MEHQGKATTASPKGRLPVRIVATGKHSFAAEVGKRRVALVSAWRDCSDRFCVLNAYVRPDYRRRGIGRALYQAIESQAGEQLVPAISLSDDGFEFWKRFRAEAVAKDLRHHKAKLLGMKVTRARDGLTGTIYSACGGVAMAEFADEHGQRVTFHVGREELDALGIMEQRLEEAALTETAAA